MIPQTINAVPRSADPAVLVSPRTRKRITKWVIIGHLIVILVPYLVGTISGWMKPEKIDTVNVDLKDIPTKIGNITNVPAGNPAPGSAGAPPPPEPNPRIPEPPAREPAFKEPAIKVPPPPPNEPRVSDETTKYTKKLQKMREETAARKKADDAKKAEQSKKFVPASQTDITQPTRFGPPGTGGSSNKGFGTGAPTTGPIGPGGRGTGEFTATYEDALGAFLKKNWDTPEKRLLNGRRPEVVVQINIASDGRIIGHRITRPSNQPLMDDSVERIFSMISRVIPPPDGRPREISLVFELDESEAQ